MKMRTERSKPSILLGDEEDREEKKEKKKDTKLLSTKFPPDMSPK
jgi:hypothetical protein